MNHHALAPKCYKRSVVEGFVHRVYRACSSWENVHDSVEKVKMILERNQYQQDFYDPIISKTIEKLVSPEVNQKDQEVDFKIQKSKIVKQNVFTEYRGIATDHYIKRLKSIRPPLQPVITLHKMRTYLPSLKRKIEKTLKSRVVYKTRCLGCNACYVGQASRHFITRFKEHRYKRNQPVRAHFDKCTHSTATLNDVKILASTLRSLNFLLALEALYIRGTKPELNTKDEYRSREVTIRF